MNTGHRIASLQAGGPPGGLVPGHLMDPGGGLPWWRVWDPRPDILVALALGALLYGVGWLRLRRAGGPSAASGARLAAYAAGLGLTAIALLSALDVYGARLFSVHMVQHLVLTLLAPPLLLWARPFPYALWALPAPLRRGLGGQMARGAPLRRGLRRLSSPAAAWLVYLGVLTVWHVPQAYGAAQGNGLVHDLEHLSFFLSACLFWWHVLDAPPQLHGWLGYGRRLSYLVLAFIHSQLLGMALAFAPEPLYPYYADLGPALGWSVMDDQSASGAIMWVPGGLVYGLAIMVLLYAFLDHDARRVSGQARP